MWAAMAVSALALVAPSLFVAAQPAPAPAKENTHRTIGGFEVERTVAALPSTGFARWDRKLTPFAFCVISDPHGREDVRAGYEAFGSARSKFRLVLDHIAGLSDANKPAFILVCGDIHPGSIKDVADQSGFVFHFIAGNHEEATDRAFLRASYPNDFNINKVESDYYSFTYNGCRFIGIGDAVSGDHVGHLDSGEILPAGQSKWLSTELKKKEAVKVVFGHIPPHPNHEDVDMYLAPNDSLFFVNLIKRTNPALLFFGHQHKPTRSLMIGSTRCYIVRSSSWNFGQAPIGYLFVNLDKDGARIEEYTFKQPAGHTEGVREPGAR
jgi:hypothetical protein